MAQISVSTRLWLIISLLAGVALSRSHGGVAPATNETNTPIAQALLKAKALYDQKNWAEGRSAYDTARDLEKNWRTNSVRLAVEGAVACSFKLEQWDDALS